MKTINIKGKEYVTVNERLKEFRNMFKDYSLTSEIIELGADFCTIKATITDDKGIVRATGFAREVVAKSPINKFAFVENCETSAMGRALGNFGIGIDDAVCTADELIMKLSQNLEENTKSEEVKAFEKEATAEKTAKTRAINKGEQPKPSNKSLETRYNDALNYVKNINKEEYLDKSKSIKDKLNTLLFDLKEKGCAGWYDNLMLEYNRLTSLEDSIPY